VKVRNLLILEDDNARVERFREVLGDDLNAYVWSNAHKMVRHLKRKLPKASLVCLDDALLAPLGFIDDLGDGHTVVSALLTYEPTCPVLVHGDDHKHCERMVTRLKRAGWLVERVDPGDPNWIEEDWIEAVRRFLPLAI